MLGAPECVSRNVSRFGLFRQITFRTQIGSSCLGQVDVDITTIVISTISYVSTVFRAFFLFVGSVFIGHTQAEEITGYTTTATGTHIVGLLQGILVQNLVAPVYIRVKIGVQLILDQVERHRRIKCFFAASQFCFVGKRCIVIGTEVFGHIL